MSDIINVVTENKYDLPVAIGLGAALVFGWGLYALKRTGWLAQKDEDDESLDQQLVRTGNKKSVVTSNQITKQQPTSPANQSAEKVKSQKFDSIASILDSKILGDRKTDVCIYGRLDKSYESENFNAGGNSQILSSGMIRDKTGQGIDFFILKEYFSQKQSEELLRLVEYATQQNRVLSLYINGKFESYDHAGDVVVITGLRYDGVLPMNIKNNIQSHKKIQTNSKQHIKFNYVKPSQVRKTFKPDPFNSGQHQVVKPAKDSEYERLYGDKRR